MKPHLLSYCCCSVTHSGLTFVTPWTAAHQASLSCTIISPYYYSSALGLNTAPSWGSTFQMAGTWKECIQFNSVQFSRSVVSNSLQPHELQHTRLILSFTISQSLLNFMSIELMMPSNHLIPFSSCPQSFPASGSFPASWLFASGG